MQFEAGLQPGHLGRTGLVQTDPDELARLGGQGVLVVETDLAGPDAVLVDIGRDDAHPGS
ncbi:hypothetical protein D3C86_2143260 [compost metagenome]